MKASLVYRPSFKCLFNSLNISRIHILLILFPSLVFSNGLDSLSYNYAFPTTLGFRNYTVNNGLPGGYVLSISQDQNGLMWFGDEAAGLVSFDGQTFEVFSHNLEDSNSLSSNRVLCIQSDKHNNLWVGTDHGLNQKKIDPANYKVNNFKKFFATTQESGLPNDKITDLLLTANSDLLIGTAKGLCVYRGDDGFERVNLGIYNDLEIRAICQIRTGNIFIGTNKGLFLLKPDYSLLFHWNRISENLLLDVSDVIEGPDKNIWISTGELYILNSQTSTFESINNFYKSDKLFNVRGINNLMLDNLGRVWIGTISTGAFVCRLRNSKIEFSDFQDLLAGGFQGDQVRAIFEDRLGVIWVAAKSKGLNVYDSKTDEFELVVPFKMPPSRSSDNSILALDQDEQGNVYFGSRSSGLAMFDPKTGVFSNFGSTNGSSLNTDRVQYIKVVSNDKILLGTDEGLTSFHKSSGTFINYNIPPVRSLDIAENGLIWAGTSNGLIYLEDINGEAKLFDSGLRSFPKEAPISVVYIDTEQNLWIGTVDDGLLKHNLRNGHTDWINNQNSKQFKAKQIRSINQDATGNIWVGTRESGLYMFRKDEFSFEHFPYKMFQGSIRGIAVDNLNNVWLVTPKNVFRLSTDTDKLSKFGKEYGLYEINSVLKTRSGLLLFGGDHSVLSYDPDNKIPKRFQSIVSIKSVTNPLWALAREKSDEYYQFIYDEPLTFEFYIDNFSSPTQNNYSFKLTGVDKDWVSSGHNSSVSYANLSPGEYTFMVKGADATGIWSGNIASIDFVVLPPWWLTLWAKLVYFLAVITLGYAIYHILAFRSSKRKELKALKYEKEQSEILTKHKLRFFTNISHELRTPLTLMIPSAEKVSDNQPLTHEELIKHGNIIKRSANTLFSLVDELIQFKRIEEGAQQFAPARTNIANLCSRVFDDLESAAVKKNIDYNLTIKSKEEVLWVDEKILEKVLRNLIFNAIKYTSNSGRVEVCLDMEKSVVVGNPIILRIDVIDNGIGISDEDQIHIFDRFYRTEAGSGFASGTGIGLDLVQNLVSLHNGTIEVQSKTAEGSHFTVRLPVQTPIHDLVDEEPELVSVNTTETNFREGEKLRDHILIVEDDPELLFMLRDLFSDNHNISIAKNGKEGIEKALEYPQPNLIISDVLMPKMNGYEVCAEIKKNFKTSHIPILLLTAKSTISDELEGLKSGANAFVTKPFYPKVLKAKVDSLLKNQKLQKEKFAREAQLNPSEIDIPDPDKQLLTACVKIIEENIQNEHFSVENLAREVGMSRTQLFRKLKYLLDVSASELIYSIRLKRAAELLKSGKLTVSEVAHMTGFATPSSFSNTFKKHYKISPKDFVEKR